MLRIRLTRIGKTNQETFRVVVAEHSKAVKKQYVELLGHYTPATQPKKLDLKKDRLEYWLKNGAQPSDTVAIILKKNGFANMDRYIAPRDKKRAKKGEEAKTAAAPAASQPVA